MNFNPHLKKFLDENKDLTVMGLFWSGYWRLSAIVIGIYIALAFTVGFIIGIAESI